MNRTKNAIRVLVADDHTVVRDGLVAIIKQEKDMDVVAEAGDGRQAVELWKKHRPDVTIMDLRMPGLEGVNAIYEIGLFTPNNFYMIKVSLCIFLFEFRQMFWRCINA